MAGLLNTLYLTTALAQAVIDHAQADQPREACGILAGADRPTRHIPMTNADPSDTRFAFDPAEQLAVYLDMDERGEQPLVIYHSHPRAQAYPSAVDILYADPDAHHLIVSLRAEPELRAFRIRGGQVTEEPLAIDDAEPAPEPSLYERLVAVSKMLPKGPHPDRVEVGWLASLALRQLARAQPESQFPATPMTALTSLRIVERQDLAPAAWQVIDTNGDIMRSGTFGP